MQTVDILIPVYRPGKEFKELLHRLKGQSYPIQRIILMNTEKEYFPEGLEDYDKRLEVHHLTKAQFDHGGTRDAGIRMSKADIVVCMTQDALPKNGRLIEELIKPFEDGRVWAAYARQLPRDDCSETERYTRSFNYPAKSFLKGKEDLSRLGIKTFFCSNVCAAWRRDKYLELGGFAKRTIFNEDMILAGKLVQSGGLIAYCAQAQVVHSHNYSAMEQFHRNFDLAVSQAMHPEIFGGIRSESEGIRLVKASMKHCLEIGKPWFMFQVFTQSAGKFAGYKLGGNYRRLPKGMVLKCTMNRTFWERGES